MGEERKTVNLIIGEESERTKMPVGTKDRGDGERKQEKEPGGE